jgi:hypothetical protein
MRLVAVGCSFLDMCRKKTLEDGTIQGTYTDFPKGTGNWGYHLAKKLNFDYLDCGKSGYSNEYMWRKSIDVVLSEKNIKDLFFVIGWTDSYRFEYYDEDMHEFYPFHTNWFWENKEPEKLNLLGKEDITKIIMLISERNKGNFMEEIQQNWLLNDKKYFGNDGWKGHPSQLGHDKWSDVIFKYIEENKIL